MEKTENYRSTDILYDCYDKDENPIGIIFAKDTAELLEKNPNVKYVRGMDYITRLPNWHEVRPDGLWPYRPVQPHHRSEVEQRFYI